MTTFIKGGRNSNSNSNSNSNQFYICCKQSDMVFPKKRSFKSSKAYFKLKRRRMDRPSRSLISYPARRPYSGELKYDQVTVDCSVNSGGAVFSVCEPARGTDIGDRIGRELTMKSIQACWSSYSNNGTGIDQNHRILIVYDRSPRGGTPAITDVIDAITPWSFRNLANRSRFIVLHDEFYSVGNDNPDLQNGGEPRLVDRKWYKIVNLKSIYNAADQLQEGGLFFMVLGSVVAGATAGSLIGQVRVRFIDS